MITAEDAVELCITIAKYQVYLKKQIGMHKYMDGKYNKLVPYNEEHLHKAKAYELALDNLNSLLGEKT